MNFSFILVVLSLLAFPGLAQSWLSPEGQKGVPVKKNSLLKKLQEEKGFLSPVVCKYDENRLVESQPFSWKEENGKWIGRLEEKGNLWECVIRFQKVTAYCQEAEVTFKLLKGKQASAGVALSWQLKDWREDNFVFIPGAAYNGNRFEVLAEDYPPMFYDEKFQGVDFPVTITDVPRLSGQGEVSKMELTTADATTPCMGFYDKVAKKGFLLFTGQSTSLGNSGLTVEESQDRKQAALVLSAPAVREKWYTGMHLRKSPDRGVDWKAGDVVTLKARMYLFPANSLQEFYTKYFQERKAMPGDASWKHRLPFSEALQMEMDLQNRERWNEAGGYYKNGNGDSPFGHIQIGWVGGLMQTYPLLVKGDETSVQRCLQTFQTAIEKVRGQSGFFYGIYKNGKVYGDNFHLNNEKPQVAMVRKNADALYYLLKQFLWLKRENKNPLIQPAWEAAVRKLADAFVHLWQKEGDFGQLVNVETGALIIKGSTAGSIAPGALALAADYFREPLYLEIAKKAAEKYYHRDVLQGYTTGGPGEILQCPDSESAFAMLESLVTLYEHTKEKKWLERARAMASICASWTVSYDFEFPENSRLGQCRAPATGAVWASIQNKHAAPGICTNSGSALLRLYRYTGETLYLDLLRDIAHNLMGFVSTQKFPVGNTIDGYVNERVNLSDWEGQGAVGNLHHSSVSWCEVSVMLTALEIPGVYLNPQTGFLWVADHIEAKVVKKSNKGVMLQMTNPTAYLATVQVMSESDLQKKQPLGPLVFTTMQAIILAPGETKEIFMEAK
ncbi:hypothetical protein AAG747_08740 [Rapidithrix thailandica]|uniref:Uncharacterized protein n=1 Tax=Rapidithrix thailandica TaxID=413964 RepID=A0AAW9RTA8_9BACT